MNDLETRRRRYFKLSSEIAYIDDRRLSAIFEAAESTAGWGRNHTLKMAGEKVFIKRVPLTDLEVANPFSTRNLYEIPTYYNYGVGSAGFGAFRELLANIKTTNWVLNGEIATFPLLYHYRICETPKRESPLDPERHKRYVEYWGGSEGGNQYILDRASATHELVLFLEYVPHVLHPWLKENRSRTSSMIGQLGDTCEFLRRRGVIHFDAHFHNVLTDGKRVYLTDFGLVLDRSFELSDEEQRFFKAHTFYDFGEVLSGLSWVLEDAYYALPDETKQRIVELCGIREGMPQSEMFNTMLRNLADLDASKIMPMGKDLLRGVLKYSPVILLMREFYSALRDNPKKDTPFPRAQLRKLLAETGYAPKL